MLSKFMGECVLRSFVRMKRDGSGPTGHMRGWAPSTRVSTWSTGGGARADPHVSVLNELTVRGNQTIVEGSVAALYVLVDDGVTITEFEEQRKTL